MKEKLKGIREWMLIHFPAGPFKGKITLELNGKNVVDSQTVNDIIKSTEKNHATDIQDTKCSCSKGKAKV